jgi:SAM-dependent methyltransferase
MRKEAVRYWDEIAAQGLPAVRDAMLAGFRSERAFDESGRVDARHLLLPFFSRSDRVLDVGCGIARLLKWVAPNCREAIGLDVSAGLLRIARERLAGLSNVRVAKLPRSLAFPIPTGTIGFAYYYHVSLHVDREDNLRILQELRRCLRPRGRALVQFSLIEHPDLRDDLACWARQRDRAELTASYFTESEAKIFLELAKLHPQLRLFIPGEFVAVVTRRDGRALGEMPRVLLHTEQGEGRPRAKRRGRAR